MEAPLGALSALQPDGGRGQRPIGSAERGTLSHWPRRDLGSRDSLASGGLGNAERSSEPGIGATARTPPGGRKTRNGSAWRSGAPRTAIAEPSAGSRRTPAGHGAVLGGGRRRARRGARARTGRPSPRRCPRGHPQSAERIARSGLATPLPPPHPLTLSVPPRAVRAPLPLRGARPGRAATASTCARGEPPGRVQAPPPPPPPWSWSVSPGR